MMLSQTSYGWQSSLGNIFGLGAATSAFTISGPVGSQTVSYTDSTGKSVTLPLPSGNSTLLGNLPMVWSVSTYGDSGPGGGDVDFVAVPPGTSPPASDAEAQQRADKSSIGLNIAQLLTSLYGGFMQSANGWPTTVPTMPKGWGYNGTGFGFPPADHLQGTPSSSSGANPYSGVYTGPAMQALGPPPAGQPQLPANLPLTQPSVPLAPAPQMVYETFPPAPTVQPVVQSAPAVQSTIAYDNTLTPAQQSALQQQLLAQTPAATQTTIAPAAPSSATSFFSSLFPSTAPQTTAPASTDIVLGGVDLTQNWMLIAAAAAGLYFLMKK